jgi:GPH family glycoside/pentoside/hexuronide:cation symporter
LSKGQKILYSLGSLGAGLPAAAVSGFLLFFYVDQLKMSPALFGLGMVIYSIWNAINDPLAGQISDNTRSKWGRRIPYIRFLMIPLAISFTLLWTPPFVTAVGHEMGMFIYFLVVLFFYDGLYTFVILNWTALFPEMFPGLKERAQVSAWRQAFGIFGNIVGVSIPPLLYPVIGWFGMGLAYALLTLIALALSLRGSKENPAFATKEGLALWPALVATLANRSFLTLVLADFLWQFSFGIILAVLPFFAKYVLHIAGLQQTLLSGIIFIIVIPMVFVWGGLSAKWGARNTVMISSAAFGLTLIPLGLASSVSWAYAFAVVVGLALAGLILLIDPLIADVVDEDEVRTGRRREGMYFGINGFMVRLSIAFQGLMVTGVMAATGYDANAAAQVPSAIAGFRALLIGAPIAALALALVLMSIYPLHGKRLAEVRATLAERRGTAKS